MCNACRESVTDHINISICNRLLTANGKPFIIKGRNGDIITIETSTGGTGSFHLPHLVDCYHWMVVLGRTILGVGNHQDSARGLVGSEGQMARCELCDRHPAYIWGVLQAMSSVMAGPGNTLSLR